MTQRSRRWFATIAMGALAASAVTVLPAVSAAAEDRTFALVGSLQSELGCAADWAPDCTETELAATDTPGVYAAEFTVPAGTYEYKVAVNDSWDESYGLDGGNIPLTVAGDTHVRVQFDDTTHRVGLELLGVRGAYDEASDAALVADPVREPGSDEQFYFVMTDRFANGDASNDEGGLEGDRLATGFDPTDKGFYHGGDLQGLRDRLDYIDGLGTTAIWLTPSFENRPVQGEGANASAGYHGYWVTDFTQIDPHLGTNAELEALIAEAHAKGIKVYFDIITNHTADVIDYEEQQYSYVDQATSPYLDADGNEIDLADYASADTAADFPALDAATSFPYTPTIRPEDADLKVPAWLNDPTLYHNRGDSTWEGESVTYGDFVGLDDLMTEHPTVVNGFVDVYDRWIDLGIDGFRIDTAKHVNFEFWEQWSTQVLDYAHEHGKPDFFMFGEVYDADPQKLSPYVRKTDMNSVLDFTFQSQAVGFASGNSAKNLQSLFAGDDYYTTPDSSASALPTFLGNHDMGRVGSFLQGTDAPLERDELAHDLLFLTRGQPVVYYGDEQGFTGPGGDKDARQTLFASQVPDYQDQQLITGETAGSVDRYGTDAPLYEHIAALSALREAHPALSTGAQIERYVDNGAGVYAFSRVDRDERVEYLVAANNATEPRTVPVPTLTKEAQFTVLSGDGAPVTTDADGVASVTVPALGAVVWQADRQVDAPAAAEAISVAVPTPGAGVTGITPVEADVDDSTWQETSFAWRVAGDEGDDAWHALGTAEDTTPRVFHDTEGLANGTLLEYRAISTDAAGHRAAASTYASVGNAVSLVVEEEPEQPLELVTVPGSHNSEMGCAGDWTPACEGAKLTLRADGVYSGTFDLPAGDYEYKVAINGSWTLNYGANGVPDGANVTYHHDGGPITFFWDPRSHVVTSTAEGPVVTVPGSFQSEIGCPGDWAPDCLASMMFDGDRDGVYTFSTDAIPEGAYEGKVAHGQSWDENYGVGGAPGGGNYAFTTKTGELVEFRYTLATHVLEIVVSNPPLAGSGEQRAHWIDADTLAWPPSLLGDLDAADASWTIEHAADAGLGTAEGESGATEVVGGGDAVELELDPAGLSEAQRAAYPALAGFLALKPVGLDREGVQQLLTEELAVAQRVSTGSTAEGAGSTAEGAELTAFTGVQIPGVLDDLYAAGAADAGLGVTWSDGDATATVWAPTAQDVALERWDAGSTGDPELVDAAFDAAAGTWSVPEASVSAGDEYRWVITVYAPTTDAIEVNHVTDPYSVALTINSTRTVVVDLDDPTLAPAKWVETAAPTVERSVDRAIYELQVRDFSISDDTVPEAERGTYRAFTRDSAGTQQLAQLADAGITTVHLLPTFDLATIEEQRELQATPQCDLASFGPASSEQQACIAAIRDADGFNWGYDPLHYQAPEGSYAVDANGGARVEEFREMVGALHGLGLEVVLDEVYNHTAESGQGGKSVLDRVVPGYYQRLNLAGGVETSTCCQNVATEHAVAEQLMVDSVVLWAKQYKVDGFRFDLMGHHSKANLLAIRAALDELTLAEDGVDGSKVFLYGEGWNFGEVADNALFEQATQGQLGGTGIGTFSDRLRDAVHGGSPVDSGSKFDQGFGTGLGTDPNAHADGTPEEQLADLAHQTDLVKLGLAGNLRAYRLTDATGAVVRGDELDYRGAPAGYADQPDEIITYVDAHDNETLYDVGVLKLPADTSMADRVRMNTLSLATTAFAQTPSFWHAGTELLRSKSLDRNSYNSGDWFNRIDWTGQESTFGSGLPMEADNGDFWDEMAPLLADPALKPQAADIAQAEASALDLLRVRSSVDLLQLGSAELIEQKVTFPNSGPDAAPGLITMLIDDTVGADVDADLDGALVVFNASTEPITQQVAGLAGREFALNEVQATGADEVVKGTGWDASTGTVTIPARSAAVLVDEEPPPAVGTVLLAAPSKLLAKAGSAVREVGQVFAVDGSRPTGTVFVRVDGALVASERIEAKDKGRFDVKLPKLGRGLHWVEASFDGDPGYADAWFPAAPILLW